MAQQDYPKPDDKLVVARRALEQAGWDLDRATQLVPLEVDRYFGVLVSPAERATLIESVRRLVRELHLERLDC